MHQIKINKHLATTDRRVPTFKKFLEDKITVY